MNDNQTLFLHDARQVNAYNTTLVQTDDCVVVLKVSWLKSNRAFLLFVE